MAWIRSSLQSFVSPIGIKEPDEAWVSSERMRSSQRLGIMVPPHSSSSPESVQARSSGQSSPAQCEDSLRRLEETPEFFDVAAWAARSGRDS